MPYEKHSAKIISIIQFMNFWEKNDFKVLQKTISSNLILQKQIMLLRKLSRSLIMPTHLPKISFYSWQKFATISPFSNAFSAQIGTKLFIWNAFVSASQLFFIIQNFVKFFYIFIFYTWVTSLKSGNSFWYVVHSNLSSEWSSAK